MDESVDNLLRGANQEVTAPAGTAPTFARPWRSRRAASPRQVGDGVPVAVLENIVTGIVHGFPLRGTAHHRASGPHLERPLERLAADGALRFDPGCRLIIFGLGNTDKHHIRVL